MYSLPDRRRAVRPSPVFLGFVAVAAAGGALAWTSHTQAVQRLGVFVFVLAAWIVSICLHEFAHAFVAYRSGDRDVEVRGYLTLNPFRYVNPLLSIVLPLVFIALGGIGLPGGAVYLHRHAFRSKLALSVAALVGPLTNLIFAAVLLYVARTHGSAEDPHLLFWSGVAFLGLLQVSAAALNLLPIPGLDGYAVLEPHLDPATARSFEKIKPFGLIAVFALLSVHQLNVWFFDVVYRIYDVSGAPESLAALGYDVFRFWKAL